MPIDKTSWKKLNDSDTKAFIKSVAAQDEPYIFNEKTCEAVQMPLPFYHGFHLVRIINKTMIPYLLLDYISNGTQHFYLDGSDAAFHHLNTMGALNLKADNVADYVDLYISYVYERGNSLEPNHKTTPHVRNTQQSFEISIELNFQERLTEGQINVSNNGIIRVTSPLEVTFLDTLDTTLTPQYRHPLENEIKDQIQGILSITDTGTNTIKKMHELQADVRILTSPAYQMLCTDTKTAYITMPATEQNAKYTQAIDFVSIIKDIELSIEKQHYRPAPYQTTPDLEVEAIGMHLGKNLESIIEMCKMVSELEDQEIPEALHALKNSGLFGVYQGHKAGYDKATLLGIYRNDTISFLEREA